MPADDQAQLSQRRDQVTDALHLPVLQRPEKGEVFDPWFRGRPRVELSAQDQGDPRRAEVTLEAGDTRDRGFHVRGCDGERLGAPRVETVVAGATCPRYPLLAEVVGNPGVATAARTCVLHDLVDTRKRVLLELGLLFEVDWCARQLTDTAVRLHHAGALEQRNRPAYGSPIDRRQPRLPVGDPTAASAQHLPVDGTHGVAIGIRLLDEETLKLTVLGAVQQDAFRGLAVAACAARLLVVLFKPAREVG